MNALTEKQRCRADCPRGNYAYKDRGEVVECEHGALFMVQVAWIDWPQRFWPSNFHRLSRIWTPFKYRRATAERVVIRPADGPPDPDDHGPHCGCASCYLQYHRGESSDA